MRIEGLDHINIRCREADLPAIRQFWGDIVGLPEGPRPNFEFPGIWYWCANRALIHIAARAPNDAPAKAPTGPFGHVALRAEGLESARDRLRAHGVEWREAPVPGFPLHQIFLEDPTGIQVELTFATDAPG